MLILVETALGFGLFRLRDENLLKLSPEDIESHFSTPDSSRKCTTLTAFANFRSTLEATRETVAIIESKAGKGLQRFLKKNLKTDAGLEKLAVSDRLLASNLQEKFGLQVVFEPRTLEIMRGIRSQFHELVKGLSADDMRTMEISLSHSLSRFRLKFSPEKVDTMVIQAISLIDDLDREINNFGMRLKEWYGWHFPELSKIVIDNLLYSKIVLLIGQRENAKHANLSSILPESIIAEIRQASEISMGTSLGEEDLCSILQLAEQLQELMINRETLGNYLKQRMQAIAPNLTYMVGEIIGARLISHGGSLANLAKAPASTVQILGAEKALFRALKTKSQTPKYGLIYHASLVGQSNAKNKGKISRILAAKLSLCTRVDAFKHQDGPSVALGHRSYVEYKLRKLLEEPEIERIKLKRPESSKNLHKKKKAKTN